MRRKKNIKKTIKLTEIIYSHNGVDKEFYTTDKVFNIGQAYAIITAAISIEKGDTLKVNAVTAVEETVSMSEIDFYRYAKLNKAENENDDTDEYPDVEE